MNYISEVLKQESPSIEDLMNCLEQVKENGDIVVLKFDGERTDNKYTVFISFPLLKKREIIRADENDLKKALIKVLEKYYSNQ